MGISSNSLYNGAILIEAESIEELVGAVATPKWSDAGALRSVEAAVPAA